MNCISTNSVAGNFEEKLNSISLSDFNLVEIESIDILELKDDPKLIINMAKNTNLNIGAFNFHEEIYSHKNISDITSFSILINAPILILKVTKSQKIILPDLDLIGNLKIALQPSREREDETFKFIKKINHPNLGIALNSSNVLGDGSRPARLRNLEISKLFFVQLADGINGNLLPLLGDLNLQGFIKILTRSGYEGIWCVSIKSKVHPGAVSAYRSLLNILNEVSIEEPLARFKIPDIASRVPATGIEFIEFAVDERSSYELSKILRSMAFRQERIHLNKDVVLWRQGAINIVVNKEKDGYAHDRFMAHGPMVCDMGLRVQNADETVSRAKALGTKSFVQNVGLGELNIPAIRGVGGSIVHFIDEKSDLHRVWDIEFASKNDENFIQPVGLRRVDHIAQTMKYDEMQDWLLYYISTFEMDKSSIINVSDPSGIVLSQAIESPEGDVRLNLNATEDLDTFAGSFVKDKFGAGVQHLAFSTDDIFESAKLLSDTGFKGLCISIDYYEKTKNKFNLNDVFIDQLKEHNILYDCDGLGEYFQLYSENLFDGFFFEIVQRKNGYSGYGARNASVRLASQIALQKFQ